MIQKSELKEGMIFYLVNFHNFGDIDDTRRQLDYAIHILITKHKITKIEQIFPGDNENLHFYCDDSNFNFTMSIIDEKLDAFKTFQEAKGVLINNYQNYMALIEKEIKYIYKSILDFQEEDL